MNYTAVLPFYGTIKNRLFRDEIHFLMLPFYGNRKKRDIVTDNYFWPFVDVHHGDGMTGWQVWPFVGREHKDVTTHTNGFGDVSLVAGHDHSFYLWPFYLAQNNGLGTSNRETFRASLPFYAASRSPQRDYTSVLWPFFAVIDEREKKYHEWQGPWPFVIFTRGEGQNTTRVWPLFSQARNDTKQSDSYLWPLFTFRHTQSAPLDQARTRVAFYVYDRLTEKNTETGKEKVRLDMLAVFYLAPRVQRQRTPANSRAARTSAARQSRHRKQLVPALVALARRKKSAIRGCKPVVFVESLPPGNRAGAEKSLAPVRSFPVSIKGPCGSDETVLFHGLPNAVQKVNRATIMFENIGEIVLLLWRTLLALPLAWRQRQKVFEQFFEIGNASLLMVCVLSFFIGAVLALQTGPLLVERNMASVVGGVVGVAIAKEMAPVMMAILIAGRIGSAMAAEIGSMRVYQEIDALRTMNINPMHYLVLPRVLAIAAGAAVAGDLRDSGRLVRRRGGGGIQQPHGNSLQSLLWRFEKHRGVEGRGQRRVQELLLRGDRRRGFVPSGFDDHRRPARHRALGDEGGRQFHRAHRDF